MNDRSLRLQIVMSAIDKLTRPFKQARASTKELASAVKKSQDALKQIDQTSGKLDGFRKLQAESQKLGDRLTYSRNRMALLSAEMGQMGPPTQRQIVALDKQRLAVQRLEDRQARLQSQTARVRAELYRAGISAADGAGATARITRETERYNRQLAEQEKRLRRASEQQRKLAAARSTFEKAKSLRTEIAGTGAGLLATGVATAMPLIAPVKAYSESEDAATQLSASMMGPGARILPEFEQINRLAVELGDRLPGTTADFQNMMTMLRRQGMSATAILGGLGEATAYLGVQLKMPATEAAEFAAKLQDATGTTEKDMMNLMDVIQKGFYAGVDPGNMLNGYAKISSAMSILKVKGIEAAKAFAPLLVMADQTGMAGESAGNAYRKVFQAAMNRDKVSGVNDDLKAAGSKVRLNFSDGKGEFAGLDNLYKQLNKLKGLSTEMRLSTLKGIFGDDAETLQILNIMIEKGIDGYHEANDKLQAQASLRERVDSQLKTLGNKWEAATGSFTNALAAIGGTVAPQLKQMADWLGELAGKLGEFVKAHPQLTSALFKIVGGFALATAALGTLGLTIAAVIGPLAIMRYGLSFLGGGAISRLLPAFGGLTVILARLAPGLTGAGSGIRDFLNSIQNSDAASILERIKASLAGIGEDDEEGGVLDALRSGVMNRLKEQAENAGSAMVNAFRNPVASLAALRAQVTALAMTGFSALSSAASRLGGFLMALVTSPLALLRTVLMGIGSLLGVLLSPIGLVIAALTAAAFVIWKYWQPITAFLGGVVEGFRAAAGPVMAAFEPMRPLFEWIGNTVKSLFGWFTDLFIPVKSTKEELASAAEMGKRFGKFLADSLAMVMSPLNSLKSGISWILEKLGVVSDKAATAKLPSDVVRNAPTITSHGVQTSAGGFPLMYGGYAGMYDSGGYIPRGQFGIVGENGPEFVNGPANVTSRRKTAALAAVTGIMLGSLATPIAAKPLHPHSLPKSDYQSAKQPSVNNSQHSSSIGKVEIHIHQQPGQSSADVADEVMRRIEAKQRQLAAKARSSFWDQNAEF